MQLKLTWRIHNSGRDIDLLVPDEQKIVETMQVLEEKGLLDEDAARTVQYVRSLRTKTQVDTLLTYKEGNIYSGDILEVL